MHRGSWDWNKKFFSLDLKVNSKICQSGRMIFNRPICQRPNRTSLVHLHNQLYKLNKIHKRDPRTSIPPTVMALSAMLLQLGVFRYLLNTHAKTIADKMHLQSLRTVWHFMLVYLHAQTIVLGAYLFSATIMGSICILYNGIKCINVLHLYHPIMVAKKK